MAKLAFVQRSRRNRLSYAVYADDEYVGEVWRPASTKKRWAFKLPDGTGQGGFTSRIAAAKQLVQQAPNVLLTVVTTGNVHDDEVVKAVGRAEFVAGGFNFRTGERDLEFVFKSNDAAEEARERVRVLGFVVGTDVHEEGE